MKQELILTGLVFLVIFMMLTDVEATPVLEFIDVPDRVKLEDAFTFSVKLTDARGYDYFSLYGETPSGEEMYFGERFFDEGLWFMYSDEWTLTFSSFNETGYYTLCVDAGAVNDPDVDMITTSCSIYVEEATVETTINGISPFWWVESVRIIAIYLVIGGVFLMLGYAAWRKRKEEATNLGEQK